MIDTHNFIDIPWYPDYKVRISTNEVLSTKKCRWTSSRILVNRIDMSWHFCVSLYKDWLMYSIWIHRMVMWIKEWPQPEWLLVCHNDGNPKNNHPTNLRYGTRSSNIQDMIKHWTHPMIWLFWDKHHSSRKIYELSNTWEVIKEYWSISECWRYTKISNSSIQKCANKVVYQTKWRIFRYDKNL